MSQKTPPEALLSAVTEATMDALREIEDLYVCHHASDAASAVREGAVLLAIARVDNDGVGDGFRYLIGLPRGVKVTPHLTCFFKPR